MFANQDNTAIRPRVSEPQGYSQRVLAGFNSSFVDSAVYSAFACSAY